MADPRRLRVIEVADALADLMHDAFASANSEKVPGLRNQILRAVDSVPANLAEVLQKSDAELVYILRRALGSANEVGVHLRRARNRCVLDPITAQRIESRRVLLCKMLNSFIVAVEHRLALEENAKRDRRAARASSAPPPIPDSQSRSQ